MDLYIHSNHFYNKDVTTLWWGQGVISFKRSFIDTERDES